MRSRYHKHFESKDKSVTEACAQIGGTLGLSGAAGLGYLRRRAKGAPAAA